MIRYFLLSAFLISVVCSCKDDEIISKPVLNITGSLATQQEAQEALDFHNKVRSDVKSPSLVWSSDLAKFAQEWADQLVAEGGHDLHHRPNNEYGENIYYGRGFSFTPLYASESWYKEIELYSYAKLSTANFQKTGHYTQMVWKTTTSIGIGIARFGDNEVIVVANYSPRGNVVGQFPY